MKSIRGRKRQYSIKKFPMCPEDHRFDVFTSKVQREKSLAKER